jgi:hypothetical protein
MKRLLSLASLACLTLALPLQAETAQRLNLEWTLLPGTRNYITTGGFQRGMAVDPLAGANGHIYIVSRADNTLTVAVLDAGDGTEIGFLDTSGISGGTFDLNMIGVAGDGVIFAANLTTNAAGTTTTTGPFKLYRWQNHLAAPQLVYSGDPGLIPGRRWGDAIAVHGAGDQTKILITSHSGNNDSQISILTPSWSGATSSFTERWMYPDPNLALGIGLSFANANTFYGTSVTGTLPRGLLHRITFDLNSGNTTTTTYTDAQFDRRHSIVGFDPARNLLIAAAPSGDDLPTRLSVYDASRFAEAAAPIQTLPFAVNNSTSGGTGAIEIHGDRVYAMLSNNGLHVYQFTNLTGIELWRLTHFGTTEGTGTAANSADPDGDGIPNILEYALGSNPLVADRTALPQAQNRPSPVPLWYLAPGERDYLSTTGDWERGMAYNPVTGNVYVVSRALSTLRVAILNGATGAHVGFLNVSGIIGAGGTFDLSLIEVAADGAIYGSNLTTNANTNPFRLYRWANEASAPVQVFAGAPGAPAVTAGRWGDNLAVRGEGAATQVLVMTHSNTASVHSNMAILQPTDGSLQTFAATPVTPPIASIGIGSGFGAGNEFWATRADIPLYRVGFDLQTGAATSLGNFGTAALTGIGPIGVYPEKNLLAGIRSANAGVYLYNLAGFQAGVPNPPLHIHTLPTSATSAGGGSGSISFGNNRMFAMHTNNGLVAFQLETQPDETTTIRGTEFASLTFTRPAPAPGGIQYIVEVSSNLVDWDADSTTLDLRTVSAEEGTETVIYRDTVPAAEHDRRFIRLRVIEE